MIIRKPYAFLIKNFRKIHVVLMLLGFFIFYKTIDTFLFVNEFMNVGVYDIYANPVSSHISSIYMLSIFIVIVGSVSILFLLRHKNKPWKSYLICIVVYTLLFFSLSMIKGFFTSYTEMVDSANIRLARDILILVIIGQLPTIGIYIMRFFGIDFKKFNFDVDLETLDLKDEDREEVEINVDFDFNNVRRLIRKFIRNVGYFYKEHKIISISLITIVLFIIIYNTYMFIFVVNRTYRQGQLYNANGYTIRATNSYFTDKDASGNIISDDSYFVIVEFIVKNNLEDRVFNTDNFHLKSGLRSYSSTEATYQSEFEDLGNCYSKVKTIKNGEEVKFIVVYKVNKSFLSRKAVIYYQEKDGLFKLRKIKLKVKDLSTVKKATELNLGDMFDITIMENDESLSFDRVSFDKNVTYRTNKCNTERCDQSNKNYSAKEGHSILSIDFGSDVFESEDMIDFLTKYGKIVYKDNKGKTRESSIESAIDKRYYGKVVFIDVLDEIALSEDVSINIVMRNKSYNYHLT